MLIAGKNLTSKPKRKRFESDGGPFFILTTQRILFQPLKHLQFIPKRYFQKQEMF